MITSKQKKIMIAEAIERMELLGLDTNDIDKFKTGVIPKVHVFSDAEKARVYTEELNEEDIILVKNFEEKYDQIVYYLISDEVCYPDGYIFKRLTMVSVDTYTDDYSYIKDDCIGCCNTLPAYVYNTDDPDCSEIEEFSLCHNGILGGGLIVDNESIIYKTNKL